jgi:thioredoxin-like negative regulator of GroEL
MKLTPMHVVSPAAVVLAAVLLSAGPQASEIPWRERPAPAFAEAADEGRPMIVDLWAVWCEPCKVMEATTYKDPRVVEVIGDFIPLKLHLDANDQSVARYEVVAYPTTLFLDGNGDEIGRLAGMVEADPMLDALLFVQRGYADFLSNVQRKDPSAQRAAADYLLDAGNEDRAARLLQSALKAAKKSEPGAAEGIELDLARAFVAEGRIGAAVKTFERLSESGSTAEIRGHALLYLIKAERERGRDEKAIEAYDRLAAEYPELADTVSFE